jgi:hypothetical protein
VGLKFMLSVILLSLVRLFSLGGFLNLQVCEWRLSAMII